MLPTWAANHGPSRPDRGAGRGRPRWSTPSCSARWTTRTRRSAGPSRSASSASSPATSPRSRLPDPVAEAQAQPRDEGLRRPGGAAVPLTEPRRRRRVTSPGAALDACPRRLGAGTARLLARPGCRRLLLVWVGYFTALQWSVVRYRLRDRRWSLTVRRGAAWWHRAASGAGRPPARPSAALAAAAAGVRPRHRARAVLQLHHPPPSDGVLAHLVAVGCALAAAALSCSTGRRGPRSLPRRRDRRPDLRRRLGGRHRGRPRAADRRLGDPAAGLGRAGARPEHVRDDLARLPGHPGRVHLPAVDRGAAGAGPVAGRRRALGAAGAGRWSALACLLRWAAARRPAARAADLARRARRRAAAAGARHAHPGRPGLDRAAAARRSSRRGPCSCAGTAPGGP